MKLYSQKTLFLSVAATAFLVCLATIKFTSRNSNIFSEDTVTEESDSSSQTSEDLILETNTPVLKIDDSSARFTLDEQQNISVYEKCNEAVVNITTQVMGYNWFYEPVYTSSGSGSGSIIDKRGYVVTNVHVIENASVITISLSDGSSYEGKIVGQDKESDIAVLKFEVPQNVVLKTISFGDATNLKVGQKVIAIGNPFGLERTMTTGIISGLGRPIQESQNVIIRNMIQTDAAINPGNSGGPLLDSQGRMIGINTIIYSKSGSSSGVGFAIPVSTARRVVSDLLKFGKVNRGVMKLDLIQNTARIANYAGYNISTGMIVSRVRNGSRADQAGIQGGTQAVKYGTFNPQTIYLGGDIIVAIDNIEITKLADYYSALESKVPGDSVNVTVIRKGKKQTLKVVLEASDTSSY
ncbi:MAG: trypsin-like peptidase domain-containing protein [Treponema sp.]|nr:trypsin-like peptidase domain-containing protein [Spirochaetia bacterium]MEE0893665.1 trypsin-like peptidase domain-containing protein [Treponema sp.]